MKSELIFVTNITNYISGKNCHVEKFWEVLEKVWKMLRSFGKRLNNFGRFCHNLCVLMWRKIEPKKYICGEKMTNMRSALPKSHRKDHITGGVGESRGAG